MVFFNMGVINTKFNDKSIYFHPKDVRCPTCGDFAWLYTYLYEPRRVLIKCPCHNEYWVYKLIPGNNIII